MKNRGGFIIKAIRENYQDTQVQKERQVRAEKVREKELEDLTAEFRVKRDNILRQAVHAQPTLVESAAEKIQSYFVRERLLEHESAIEAYQKGGMVKAEIDGILAAEFCQALLAPVVEAYQDEKDEGILRLGRSEAWIYRREGGKQDGRKMGRVEEKAGRMAVGGQRSIV